MSDINLHDFKMNNFGEIFNTGLKFHGHLCPAMPMGLRAGLAAMKVLGVERSQDKELHVLAETGKGHAAGCFLDGVMTATGCTYGKSNIEKLYHHKMAFTLIDMESGKAVRVSLKPDFFKAALDSPFVQQRKASIPPQDIDPAITDPQVKKILDLPEEQFLDIGHIRQMEVEKVKSVFEAEPCAVCGELTFINKLERDEDGNLICMMCRQ